MTDYANQQQKIKEATEQLEAGIKEFFSSDKFQECKIVIASTIQLSPYDGRYSQDMKEAAAKVVIPGKNTDPLHDRRLDYHINCHPVTVNVAMRDLLVIERQQEKPAQRPKRKESVLGKLKRNQAAIAAGTSAAKENAKETPQLS